MSFPTSPMDGQIYKNKLYRTSTGAWVDNTLVENQIDISTATGINIRNITQTAPIGIVELFRISSSALTTAGFFTLYATRGNFVHVSNWSWVSNHQSVGYGSLAKLNTGSYSQITVYLDVYSDGSCIVSANWGAIQGYQLSVIKTAGAEISFNYANTLHTSAVSGYTRYTATS